MDEQRKQHILDAARAELESEPLERWRAEGSALAKAAELAKRQRQSIESQKRQIAQLRAERLAPATLRCWPK